MSALRNALKAVKNDIVVQKKFVPSQNRPKQRTARPAQTVNGYPVQWAAVEEDSKKIPFIQTDTFYVQYPSKSEDIKLPEGTVRASYNKDKKRVEFFKTGAQEPSRYVNDAVAMPLPVPRYMSELEKVEEIFDINFETGELTTGMKVDILPEAAHWKLRLQEFEAQQRKYGVPEKHISFRLDKYLKNLEATRGVTVDQLAEPIPQTILDAIAFAEEKQRMQSVGGKR